MVRKMVLALVILFQTLKVARADAGMYAACQAACYTGCATTGPGFAGCYAACQMNCTPLLTVPGPTVGCIRRHGGCTFVVKGLSWYGNS